MSAISNGKTFSLIVIEDRSDNREFLNSSLEKDHRFQIHSYSSFDELNLFESEHTPTIFLINSDLFFRSYPDRQYLPDILNKAPVIFTIPEDDPQIRLKCFELGAIDCICEPFFSKELLARVENHLSIRSRQDQVIRDRDQKDTLLNNVFPQHMINSLASGELPQPEEHHGACVLFTDFVGFTSISRDLGPAESVSSLNKLFFTFDEIIHRFKVERIKTIGDAYMAVSGVNHVTDHPLLRLVLATSKINEAVEVFNSLHKDTPIKWQLRSGIHQGLIIAGIVGQSKYAFDVWGDTVNIASRLETLGKPGKITLCDDTFNNLPAQTNLYSTETREVLNWGYMTIHHITGPTGSIPEKLKAIYDDIDPMELIYRADHYTHNVTGSAS